MKEKLGLSDIRKEANRVSFGKVWLHGLLRLGRAVPPLPCVGPADGVLQL
jgi:hypothetical protein